MVTKIRVAIVDTGINEKHKDLISADIEKYEYDYAEDKIKISQELQDDYGHGTGCAWIIHKHAPTCKLISIQVLDKVGIGKEEGVIAALYWCLDNDINIINLSLGTFSPKYMQDFIKIGKLAEEKNVLISAAYSDTNSRPIPARLINFYGVKSDAYINKDKYWIDNEKKDVWANGGMQKIGWGNGSYTFISGSSFANAHFCGIIANKIAKMKKRHIKIQDIIMNNAQNSISKEKANVSEADIIKHNGARFSMEKVLIFPFTKEVHSLLRFEKQRTFDIIGIVDFSTSLRVGQDAYRLLNINTHQKLIISKDITEYIDACDTILISRTSTFEKYTDYNILKQVVKCAIEHNKNIYSLEYLDFSMYPDLYDVAESKGLKIRHPMLSERELESAKQYILQYDRFGSDIPIIGVFGTGSQQGKFTVQLTIREVFKNCGYKVVNLGTEIESEIQGLESFYPMEIEQSIKFDKWEMIEYLQGEIRRLELLNPDMIVVGAQSGVIPYSYSIGEPNYTLPSLAFLMGTLPQCYILTFNISDSMEYVKSTIQVLEKLGKGKVILLVFSDNPKTRVGKSGIFVNKKLSEKEIANIIKKFETEIGIPTTEIISEKGKKILKKVIMSFYGKS